jgi:hypothetical protein
MNPSLQIHILPELWRDVTWEILVESASQQRERKQGPTYLSPAVLVWKLGIFSVIFRRLEIGVTLQEGLCSNNTFLFLMVI